MSADPNARRDQKLEGILGALKETNKLLSAQNKILERMERNGRVQAFPKHPYLERSDGQSGRQSTDQGVDDGSSGGIQSPVPGGDQTSSGESLGGGTSGR
jgi:hypothetical protein